MARPLTCEAGAWAPDRTNKHVFLLNSCLFFRRFFCIDLLNQATFLLSALLNFSLDVQGFLLQDSECVSTCPAGKYTDPHTDRFLQLCNLLVGISFDA